MSVSRLRGARAVAPSVQQIPRSLMFGLLDTQITSSITKDGSNLVSSWTDIITGQAWTQSTDANKPTYRANGFGGRPDVAVFGAGSLRNANTQAWPVAEPFWAFVLADCQNPIPSAASPTILSWPSSTAGAHNTIRTVGATSVVSGGVSDGATTLFVTDTIPWRARSLLVLKSDGAIMSLEKDGVLIGSRACIPGTSGAINRNTLFGQSATTANVLWTGSVSAVAITKPLPAQWEAVAKADLMARRG